MRLQEFELLSCFNAFRHDAHMEPFPHANHGADDTRIVRICSNIAHERLIDFQGIEKRVTQLKLE